MAVDWDGELLGPTMAEFGEADPNDPTNQAAWPLYTPRGGTPFALADAVFDAECQTVDLLQDGTVTTNQHPVLGVRLALFAVPPAQNDTVLIPRVGKLYLVIDVRPDGRGWAKLILQEKKK